MTRYAFAVLTLAVAACADQARQSTLAAGAGAPQAVEFQPTGVSLDYVAGEMELRGTLVNTMEPAPNRVWVWAYFVNPAVSPQGSWSDAPIAVDSPFIDGDTATIVARGSFHWATNPDLPRAGYHARTSVSATSADGAQVPSAARIYSPVAAVPVTAKQ